MKKLLTDMRVFVWVSPAGVTRKMASAHSAISGVIFSPEGVVFAFLGIRFPRQIAKPVKNQLHVKDLRIYGGGEVLLIGGRSIEGSADLRFELRR